MRTLMVASIALTFTAGFVADGQWQTPVRAQEFSVTMDCGASSAPQIRTTLYFGLSRPKGSVSELEWQIFMRDEVTKRFPDGLTVWQAEGQWQTPGGGIDREQSKVLLLVHGDTTAARQSVQASHDDRSVAVGHRQSDARAQRRAGEAAGQGLYCGGEPGAAAVSTARAARLRRGSLRGKRPRSRRARLS